MFDAAGLRPGSKVAHYLYNGPEYIEATFAAFKCRAVPVNVNYRYTEHELRYLFANSDAEAIVVDDDLAPHVDALLPELTKVRLVVRVGPNGDYEQRLASVEPMPRIDRRGETVWLGGATGDGVFVGTLAGDCVTGTDFASLTPAQPLPTRLPLEVSGNNGVVQLLLPIEVYQHSQSADLADLRVYNSAGVALPYALHRPSYRTRIQFREGNAALFPIYDHAQPGTGGSNLELQLRSGADGSLLTVRSPDAVAASDRLSALIIDLGPSDRAEVLESLAFDLPEATSDYQAHLAIERSDDLKLWDGVAYGAIDWLSGADAGQRLVNDRVDLPNGDGRYLKVRWIDGEPVQFGAVHTRWRSATPSSRKKGMTRPR